MDEDEIEEFVDRRTAAAIEFSNMVLNRLETELGAIAEALRSQEAKNILEDPEIARMLWWVPELVYVAFVAEMVNAVKNAAIGEPVFVGKNTGVWTGPFSFTLAEIETTIQERYERRLATATLSKSTPVSMEAIRKEVFDALEAVGDRTIEKIRDFIATYAL